MSDHEVTPNLLQRIQECKILLEDMISIHTLCPKDSRFERYSVDRMRVAVDVMEEVERLLN